MKESDFLKGHTSIEEDDIHCFDDADTPNDGCWGCTLEKIHATQIDKTILDKAIIKCTMKDGVHGDTNDTLYPDQLKKELGIE